MIRFVNLVKMPIKYIGQTTWQHGKTLWEIVGNLKNLGVGRIVVRNETKRYPERSWFKILQVDTLANPAEPSMDNYRKAKVIVEKVFRGRKYPTPICVERVSYKPDWRLLPKSEEAEFCKLVDSPMLPAKPLESIPLPPLMKELFKQSGMPEEKLRLKLYMRNNLNNRRQPAQGHIPEPEGVPVNQTLDKPVTPRLYENVLQ